MTGLKLVENDILLFFATSYVAEFIRLSVGGICSLLAELKENEPNEHFRRHSKKWDSFSLFEKEKRIREQKGERRRPKVQFKSFKDACRDGYRP